MDLLNECIAAAHLLCQTITLPFILTPFTQLLIIAIAIAIIIFTIIVIRVHLLLNVFSGRSGYGRCPA